MLKLLMFIRYDCTFEDSSLHTINSYHNRIPLQVSLHGLVITLEHGHCRLDIWNVSE
jgi:hypothetical protein